MTRLLLLLALCAGTLTAGAQNIATKVIGNATYTNAIVASTRPCKLYQVLGYNSSASTQYIQVHQTNAIPANGVVPIFSFPVATGNYFSLDFGVYGVELDAVMICNSSTADTKTIGSTDCGIQAVISK